MITERPVVFVVDDDSRVRDALSSLLASAGLDVAVFASATEFLKADKPDAPACLVLDLELPDINGLELQKEIYVRRFPDDGTKVRVSMSGGVVPYWSPNGRELIYRTHANQVMVLTYKVVGDSFTAGNARPWSQHTLADTGVLPNFAVDSTGERILALIAAPEKDPQTANHVTVIVNFDELVRRAAAR